MSNALRRLRLSLTARLFGGRRFRPHEQAVIEATRTALDANELGVFNAQIRELLLIQRGGGNRIVHVFFDEARTPRFDVPEEYCLSTVRLRMGDRRVTARVMVWRGKLSTIEFQRLPAEHRKLSFEVLKAERGGSNSRVTEVANRLEHGKDLE